MGVTVKENENIVSKAILWKKKLVKVFGHVGLWITLMLYTVLGGVIFRELEYPSEIARIEENDNLVRERRQEFLFQVADLKQKNLTKEDFEELLDKQLQTYEAAVQEATSAGITVPFGTQKTPEEVARWDYWQAIFFASTVLTTIGYGNIVPVTLSGRIFCLLFALIGIPLCVSVIADLGSLAANGVPQMPSWIESISGTIKSLVSAIAALLLLLIYLSVGATLFMFVEEEWTFFDSFYFCFITMTTIGFGDLVPQKPEYMLLCTLYILIGLGLTSTIIEIVRNEYAQSWKRLQALADALRKLGEGGGSTDMTDLQNDLRKAMTGLVENQKGSKHWEKTINSLVQNIGKSKPQPKIVQIIVYETSV